MNYFEKIKNSDFEEMVDFLSKFYASDFLCDICAKENKECYMDGIKILNCSKYVSALLKTDVEMNLF